MHRTRRRWRRASTRSTHGSAAHTDILKTEALKQALDKYGFDAAFGGARRDEEKSRAKERIFSFRSESASLGSEEPAAELWSALRHAERRTGESIRVFPLSNWTELDVWRISTRENIPSCRSISPRTARGARDGALIMVDDERLPLEPGETAQMWKCASAPWAAIRLQAPSRATPDSARGHDRGNAAPRDERTPRPRHRSRPGRFDGEEEAGGLFLMSRATRSAIARTSTRSRVKHRALLRFITCGSVDDGKSTLIGRLL